MKTCILICLAFTFSLGLYAQELDSLKSIMDKKDEPAKAVIQDSDSYAPVIVDDKGDEVNVKVLNKEIVKVIENGDSTLVKVGKNGVIQVIDQPDSTSIRVGDKEIRIVENNNDTNFKISDVHKEDTHITNPKFRGHWAGIEWGLNNFLDNNNSISRDGQTSFMDLNTGRSWAINFNFAQYSLGFGTSHLGILTGLGLEYNNYFFDHSNSIVESNGPNDYVVADTLLGNVGKSKLTTSYLRVPLILEVQFPKTIRAKRLFLSAGIVAGLKLGSHTKVVYKGENGKNKDKNNDDFNINPFRYGITARLGFGNVNVFGDYYFTPMFVNNKGPELHPISVGIAMTF